MTEQKDKRAVKAIEPTIITIRGHKVILDRDLAKQCSHCPLLPVIARE